MASTSAVSIQKRFKYDVFLSFKGEDTRKNFVDHLYHALTQKGVYTYRDDEEIEKGKRIGEQLIRSITDSRFYIIVLSRNYASSSWCLDELVNIMECQKMNEHTAYPVFYDVEPTEVRKQIGTVGEAFSKHEGEESAGKWRESLSEAANLAGWESKTTADGHEAKLIQKIVEKISRELHVTNFSANGKLVGMEKRIKTIISSLEVGLNDVRMIGIWGIGGGGKTTLAKAVFDEISFSYEGSSFVENVRETSKGSPGGLKLLQKQILSDVLKDSNGVSDFERMMSGRKILLVLDDVDDIDQLEALAGATNWLKPGSRVIITTRDKQVLLGHGVPKNFILHVNLLSRDEAKRLFNRHAFGSEIPDDGFEILSDQAFSYANGLPLTIKVLGSLLRGKDKHVWIDALDRLKEIPLKKTLDILALSYNSLEAPDYKDIFLDVACILKGWKKEEAIIALESCGYHATNGLEVLEQRSLITVSYDGALSMHDHIEEMGKNIVRRLHPKEPYNHSRLWVEKEIKDILVGDKGTELTSCISLRTVRPLFAMKGLQKMKKLRLLSVECMRKRDFYNLEDSDSNDSDLNYPALIYNAMREDDLFLPNSLQYLHWSGFRCMPLPKSFHANNLVGLYMYECLFNELWEGGEKKVLKELKFIELGLCSLRTLDMGLALNLERLKLDRCWNLAELCLPTESFKLKFLSISGCKLKSLDLARSQNLETLAVVECEDLAQLQMPVEISKLQFLRISMCGLKTLDLAQAQNLETLAVEGCKHLAELYMPAVSFKLTSLRISWCRLKTLDLAQAQNLETLVVEGCKHLAELYMPAVSCKLKSLSIRWCRLKTLDLAQAQNLETLAVEGCKHLAELYMPAVSFKLTSLSICWCRLKTLDLARAQNLETLAVEECEDLVELQMPIENLKLKDLFVRCSKLKTLKLTSALNLQRLNLIECEYLVELHMPVKNLSLESVFFSNNSKLKTLDLDGALNHGTLHVDGCHDLVVLQIESLMLKDLHLKNSKLKTLNLQGVLNIPRLCFTECEELEELHLPINNFKLESFAIHRSKLKTLDLTGAQNLCTIHVEECHDLVVLQIPLESLNLKTLCIKNSKLKTLNLRGALNLEILDLIRCDHLEELCLPVESFELERVAIHYSKLRTLDLSWARNLKKLMVEYGHDMVELHMPVESLMLEEISLEKCSKLKALNLTSTLNLCRLTLRTCKELEALHMPAKSLMPLLKDISLEKCSKLKTLNLTSTLNLETLYLIKCKELEELHMPVKNFKLRHLGIHYSKLRTLDLAGAQILYSVRFENCKDLVKLQMPVDNQLEHLSLHCSSLKTLNLTSTLNLKRLCLEECVDLEALHMPVENFKLKYLFISNFKLKTLDLAGAQNLVTLHVERCKDLVKLQMPVKSLKLKDICLKYSSLKTLNLKWDLNLKKLNLTGCEDLRTLYLGASPNFKRLNLKKCCSMEEIHAPIGCLNDHVHISSSGCVRFNPFWVNQGSPMVLTELHLITRPLGTVCQLHPDNSLHKLNFKCVFEESRPSLTGNLKKVLTVHLCTCTNLASFLGSSCGLQRLRKLTLEGSIPEFPMELEQLQCLEELNWLSTNIKHLPDNISMLKNLKSLKLESCVLLEFPIELEQLECLEELNLLLRTIKHLPDNISMLKNIKSLKLESCVLLEQLPEDIGRLECLEELRLTSCTSLRDIPNSISEMKSLKYFHLTDCILVEKLPEDISRLEFLEELHLTRCTSLRYIPNSISEMKSMKYFHLTDCILVEKLPDKIGRLKCLKELNIRGTGIRVLPWSISHLKDLRIIASNSVFLDDNPFCCFL